VLIISHGDPRDPQAQALLHSSHALMLDLFPAEDNYSLEIDDLLTPDIRFFIAREGAHVLGTGALAIREGYGEVKSMFTDKGARGKGVAAALLRQIEDTARDEGLTMLKLETGNVLHAAHRLYARHGFTECGVFGDYVTAKSSIFMEKAL
jgi:putative acetyltransferase